MIDVCVGWGGRMLGSACVDGVSYTGIEPFLKRLMVYNALKELGLEQVTLYNDVAENVLPNLDKEYDLALTSPPYYNLEIYSNKQHNHTIMVHMMIGLQVSKPVIHGVLDKLIDGGKSCWSVKNFKTDKQYNLLDDVIQAIWKDGLCYQRILRW